LQSDETGGYSNRLRKIKSLPQSLEAKAMALGDGRYLHFSMKVEDKFLCCEAPYLIHVAGNVFIY
jgi:hypothetical protein